MYLGPNEILLAATVEFRDETTAREIKEASDDIVARLRQVEPRVTRLFLRADSPDRNRDGGAEASWAGLPPATLSSPGDRQNGFPDLRQSDLADLRELDMRDVRPLVRGNDCIDDRRSIAR
jgi:hypothetical protein